jgi:hypothetical protein
LFSQQDKTSLGHETIFFCGYVGEPSIKTPQKKQKNKELTPEQKQLNKELSSERIFVEHIIRFVKIFTLSPRKISIESS